MTWHLIDIHAGCDEYEREFLPRYAIWNTVTSTFVNMDGEEAWDTRDEFGEGLIECIKRGRSLFPREDDGCSGQEDPTPAT